MVDKLGKLIVIEGPDGCGKTTQLEYLKKLLVGLGKTVAAVREPGGTPAGDKIRSILSNDATIGPFTELLLFNAARRHLYDTVITPHLRLGNYVITDRFVPSTKAYQGAGRGLSKEIEQLEQCSFIITSDNADLIIYLDVDQKELDRRRKLRNSSEELDKFETADGSFHQLVRDAYPQCIDADFLEENEVVINGHGSEQEVSERIKQAVVKFLDGLL